MKAAFRSAFRAPRFLGFGSRICAIAQRFGLECSISTRPGFFFDRGIVTVRGNSDDVQAFLSSLE
ncbi:MAG: hypothetical protein KGL39_16810 [Patescibacteria group bacterium]|nr:hypothetical protein [Patescibacteria group bacterium]